MGFLDLTSGLELFLGKKGICCRGHGWDYFLGVVVSLFLGRKSDFLDNGGNDKSGL